MHNKQGNEHARRPWRLALALCCALLLVFAATVQIAHVHSAEGVSHAGCALCATAHVVIAPATPGTVPLAARQTTAPVVDLQPAIARRFSRLFALHQTPACRDCFFLKRFQQAAHKDAPGGQSMHSFPRRFVFAFFPFLLLSPAMNLHAQTAAGTITGTVTDGSGAVIPDATVTIENPVSGLKRSAKTDAAGQYKFTNLPFNPYHLVVHAPGFAEFTADVPVRSSVAVTPSHQDAGRRGFDHGHGHRRRSGGE